MIIDITKIDDIISYKYELDFIELTLTQQINHKPVVFSGPGGISQRQDGSIKLKMYHKFKDKHRELFIGFQHHEVGKIISDENYFSLEGLDMNGNKCFSKNIWISGTVSLPAGGRVIETELDEIVHLEKSDNQNEKQTLIIVCPGEYKLPCNEMEEYPNGGKKFNRTVFQASNFDFDIKSTDKYLCVKTSFASSSINEKYYFSILEALSIITGKLVHPIAVMHYHKNGIFEKIIGFKKYIANNKVNPPFRHSNPLDIKSFSNFFNKYLIIANDPDSQLFGYWYKVNRAWQADIENMALALTVSIEGILKKYFSQYGYPDAEIIAQAKDVKKLIEESNLGDRITKRMLGNLSNLNHPSPKSVLFELVKKSIIPKEYANSWVVLRNKSAHAAEINPDQKTFQQHLDRINICLTLFYSLLFLVIGYQGKYINYSIKNWPENDF